MFHCKDLSKIVRNTYKTNIIDEIDLEDIKKMLEELNYLKCKIVLMGNDLLA